MKTTVKGRNYNFCIVAGKGQFFIEATDHVSSRYSFINNLNAILSEFNIGINDKRAIKSQWIVSKKLGSLFFKKALKLLTDDDARVYIERRLDEDRNCGEWENRKKDFL